MENKLPEGWEWKKLGDITTNYDGKRVPLKKEERKDVQGIYPYYGASGIIDYVNDYLFDGEYLLVGEDGANLIARSTPIAFKAIGKFWANNHAHILKTSEDVSLSYLMYYINNIDLKKYVTGTAQPKLTQQSMNRIVVPIPPLETQQKIVSILEKAEETKKLRAQADELTQRLLQSVFLEMFGDPVTNPMGWNTEKLEKLCVKIYGGGTPSKSKPEYYEGDIPWVTPKDMKQDFIQDSIDHISEKAIEESSTKLIPQYSLLLVIRSGILKHKLPTAINICKVTMNQDMKGFVFDDKLTNPFFMLYYFKIYQRDLLNRVRSVTADNLEFSQIKDIDVILPPIEQQQRFTTIVEQLERIRSNQQQSSLEINNLFDTLMQKAFTGELVA